MESKDDSFSFVDNWYPYSVLAQILHEADGGALKQDCCGVNNKHHAAEGWDLELVKHHRKYFQTPQKIIYQNSYHMLSFCTVIGLDLESHYHSRKKVQFFETRSRIIFLALTWRDEIEIII